MWYKLQTDCSLKEVTKLAERGRYKTRHHDAVLMLLEENKGKCLSVDDVCTALNCRGERIERTTVYRQLEKMTDDGDAVKYISEKGSSALYSLREKSCAPHIHLKCLDCGGLIHLNCSETESFLRHLRDEHSFTISRTNTLIYGHCGCSAQASSGKNEN